MDLQGYQHAQEKLEQALEEKEYAGLCQARLRELGLLGDAERQIEQAVMKAQD